MPFLSRDVHAYRTDLVRAFMEAHELDALAFLTPDWYCFATSDLLDVEPWERPVLVVVPRRGEPFLILNELSTNHLGFARERGGMWIDDVTLYSEHPRLTDRLHLTPQVPELFAARLAGAGLGGTTGRPARIGVDAATEPLRLAVQRLGTVTLVPLERELRDLRLVKHPEELELIRLAGALADWGQERYREHIRPGRGVQELDFAMAALIADEAARRHPGEEVEIYTFTLSGPASASPHGTGARTGQTIEAGHGLVNIVVTRLNGLVVENERTWFCGQPDDRQRAAFAAATEACAAAIEQFVTGRPLSGVDAAAQAVFQAHGFAPFVNHRTGHGIGVAGHEFPDDMPFNPRSLLEREVYSAEPGIYIPGLGGFRHDDTVFVGDAPEVVTHTPKDIASQTIR